MLEVETNIKLDFLEFTLENILVNMENENFFMERDFYVAEKRMENELVFHVYANKMFSSQIQVFKYFPNKKELIIKSRYRYKFYSGMYLLMIAMMSIVFQIDGAYENWIKSIITIFLTLIFGFLFGYLNLQSTTKEIERELIIRLKVLMRKKGYSVPI